MNQVDFDVFVSLWNNCQNLETPKLHVQIARWLQDRWDAGDRELLLMAFRNSGKSTLVGLFSAWLLSRNANLRILVLAADLALARKMVRNVKRIIERHPLTAGLKPKRADQWASEQFTVNRDAELRDPSMLARGIGANVTGSRADIIICDDVEVPNTCDTAPKREDLRRRLAEMEYVLVPGGLQLYVGTPHTYYTIYANKARSDLGEEVPYLDGFARLELPLLTASGSSRWPERFPDAHIEALRSRSGPNKFASQMLLRPANILNGRLDPDRLVPYDAALEHIEGNAETVLRLDGKKMMSATCWWDPAYGAPGRGDASVVACVFSSEDGDYYLHAIRYLEHDPARTGDEDEASQLCRKVATFLREFYLPAVTVETNGVGKFLPGLLRREISLAGLMVPVLEKTTSRSKDLRILEAFDALLAAGRLKAHRSVWETPFVREMREWRPSGHSKKRPQQDDGLDAVAGCLAAEPVRFTGILRNQSTGGQKPWRPAWAGGRTFKAKTRFKV